MQLLFAQVWRRRRWRLAHDTNNWMALGRPAQSQSRPTRASKWRVGGLAGVTVAVLRFGWSVVDDEKTETKKEWAVPRRSYMFCNVGPGALYLFSVEGAKHQGPILAAYPSFFSCNNIQK